jgi:hypothetical protein
VFEFASKVFFYSLEIKSEKQDEKKPKKNEHCPLNKQLSMIKNEKQRSKIY